MQPSQPDPLRPNLREAAETLEQALTEACASKSAHEADTGELIRVEEMLALASEAARRAISIRRKARHDAKSAIAEPAGEPAADQPPAVAHRLFEDARGVTWDVWAVYPEGRPSQLSALPVTFQSGWLVFESPIEKRRLSPIPGNWASLAPGELERLCEQAKTAQRRTRTPPPGGRSEDAPPREG
ncbi:MAG: hypothetical protein M3282_10630 [Gemmatimonadota bacterium]|nr:hypothetical protein [Gemmatimonadota bacterium]